jgi:hypothetical protein
MSSFIRQLFGGEKERRIRKMLESLPMISDTSFVLGTGEDYSDGAYPGRKYCASEGRDYSTDDILAFITQFLALGQRKKIQSTYAIGLVAQKTAVFASRTLAEKRTHVVEFFPPPKVTPTKLQIAGSYQELGTPLRLLGRITIIRTGSDTLKGCFQLYTSIADLEKAEDLKPRGHSPMAIGRH